MAKSNNEGARAGVPLTTESRPPYPEVPKSKYRPDIDGLRAIAVLLGGAALPFDVRFPCPGPAGARARAAKRARDMINVAEGRAESH